MAWSRPVPAPSRPRAAWRPGARLCSSSSKALATWPLVDSSLTSRSLVPGRRTVRSPETLLGSRMSRSPDAGQVQGDRPRDGPGAHRAAAALGHGEVAGHGVGRQVPGDAGGLHRARDRLGLGGAAEAGQGDLAADRPRHHRGPQPAHHQAGRHDPQVDPAVAGHCQRQHGVASHAHVAQPGQRAATLGRSSSSMVSVPPSLRTRSGRPSSSDTSRVGRSSPPTTLTAPATSRPPPGPASRR